VSLTGTKGIKAEGGFICSDEDIINDRLDVVDGKDRVP